MLSPATPILYSTKLSETTGYPNCSVVSVTAGNLPEYNKSVREFDVVTLYRVKKIDVSQPDYGVWKEEYAVKKGLHGSVITYLEIKKDNFYSVESTVDGKAFVTARGWDRFVRNDIPV